MESEQKTLRVKKDLSGTTYEEITMAQKKEGPPTRETLDYMSERRRKEKKKKRKIGHCRSLFTVVGSPQNCL